MTDIIKVRLKRQWMAFASYVLLLLPLLYAVEHRQTELTLAGMGWYSMYIVLVNALFFGLIRSGVSQRLKDSSMTFAQIALAILAGLVLMRYAGEIRPLFLMMFSSTLFFGVFALTQRQFLGLSLGTLIGYALLVGTKVLQEEHPVDEVSMFWLEFGTLAGMMAWVALIGGYVAKMRGMLLRQRQDLAEAVGKLKHLASRDELTGLYNRRHMMGVMDQHKANFDRLGHPFSVCLLDIDWFKKINDTHGHVVGDEVLQGFAARLLEHTRKMDLVGCQLGDTTVPQDDGGSTFGRYGGEEFILLLPHTKVEQAQHAMERLREVLHHHPIFTSIGVVEVTFSAGVAEHQQGETTQQTLGRADQALYQAKSQGRNQTQRG